MDRSVLNTWQALDNWHKSLWSLTNFIWILVALSVYNQVDFIFSFLFVCVCVCLWKHLGVLFHFLFLPISDEKSRPACEHLPFSWGEEILLPIQHNSYFLTTQGVFRRYWSTKQRQNANMTLKLSYCVSFTLTEQFCLLLADLKADKHKLTSLNNRAHNAFWWALPHKRKIKLC